jgi:hypothetical protein
VEDNSQLGFGILDFFQNGTFVYASGTGRESPEMSIFWLGSAGQIQPLHSTPEDYRNPRFSTDGNRLAFVTLRGTGPII